MWGYLFLYLVGFIVTWILYAKQFIEDDRPEEDFEDYATLAATSGGIALLWPVTILVFPARILLKKMVAQNDRFHQSWKTAGEDSPWAELLVDDRAKFKHEVFASRCKFCHYGPLGRDASMRRWLPCEKEECATVISMDEDMRALLERPRATGGKTTSFTNPFNNPTITSPNISTGTTTSTISQTYGTSAGTSSGYGFTTTANLDSHDYNHSTLTSEDLAKNLNEITEYIRARKEDMEKAEEDNKEPWTDHDITFSETEKSA